MATEKVETKVTTEKKGTKTEKKVRKSREERVARRQDLAGRPNAHVFNDLEDSATLDLMYGLSGASRSLNQIKKDIFQPGFDKKSLLELADKYEDIIKSVKELTKDILVKFPQYAPKSKDKTGKED